MTRGREQKLYAAFNLDSLAVEIERAYSLGTEHYIARFASKPDLLEDAEAFDLAELKQLAGAVRLAIALIRSTLDEITVLDLGSEIASIQKAHTIEIIDF
ncbi:MAG: hypothetical protein AAGB48_08480 [Planctomycetota bacterium]